MFMGPPPNELFLIALTERAPLCMAVQARWAWSTITTLEEQTPEGSETE